MRIIIGYHPNLSYFILKSINIQMLGLSLILNSFVNSSKKMINVDNVIS